MLKSYIIQRSAAERDPRVETLYNVDYALLLKTLRFPVLWVYEHYLQAWLPREVDEVFLERLVKPTDERFDRRLQALGLVQELHQVRWEELKESMKRDGYVKVPGILAPGLCKQLSDYYFRQPETHDRWRDMPGIKRTSVNDSPLMRLVHESTVSLCHYVLGDIKASYSFTSAYESGTILPKHTDRPQCVYNASIILSTDPTGADPKAWPLFIEVDGTAHKAELGIGDAVLYAGTRDPHWRDMLPVQLHGVLGTFFHYVPADFAGTLA